MGSAEHSQHMPAPMKKRQRARQSGEKTEAQEKEAKALVKSKKTAIEGVFHKVSHVPFIQCALYTN